MRDEPENSRTGLGEARRGALYGTLPPFPWWGFALLNFAGRRFGALARGAGPPHRLVAGLPGGPDGVPRRPAADAGPVPRPPHAADDGGDDLPDRRELAGVHLVHRERPPGGGGFGYFINPLVNVAFGAIFLHERLRRPQLAAVGLAALGVAWLTIRLGHPPWIALVLAISFAIYGLLRKLARPTGIQGLTLETTLLAPLAIAFLCWREARGELAFGHAGLRISLLLCAAGPITALPLIWYAEGARRLRFATVGFLQYLSPSLQFLLAVLAFGEPFTPVHAVGFGAIWAALVVYSWDTARGLRRA